MAAAPARSPLVRRFAVGGIALLALALVLGAVAAADLAIAAGLAGVMLVVAAWLLLHSRRTGEPAEQRRLVEALGLAGEEDVLVLGDPRLTDIAQAHLPGGRAQLSAFDATDLPFPSSSFDAVVSALALHGLPDRDARDRACAEVARVLRPGGRTALLEYWRLARELELGLEDAGLQEVRRSGLRRSVFPPARRVGGRRPARRVD